MLAPALHVPIPVDHARQDLGPAEVDPDDAFSVQGARLPYFVDGYGREALPRLPRRAHEGQGSAGTAAGSAGPQRPGPTSAEDPEAATAVELEAPDQPRPRLSIRSRARLGDRRLRLVPQRRRQGQPAARSG